MQLKLKDLFNILVFPFFVYLLGYGLEVGVPAYQIVEWPNRGVHFLGGLSAAVAVYFVLDLLKRFRYISTANKIVDAGLVVISVLAIAGFWEFYEYFSDLFLYTHAQPSVDDTIKDMLMGTLGALVFCVGWGIKMLYHRIQTKKS